MNPCEVINGQLLQAYLWASFMKKFQANSAAPTAGSTWFSFKKTYTSMKKIAWKEE